MFQGAEEKRFGTRQVCRLPQVLLSSLYSKKTGTQLATVKLREAVNLDGAWTGASLLNMMLLLS